MRPPLRFLLEVAAPGLIRAPTFPQLRDFRKGVKKCRGSSCLNLAPRHGNPEAGHPLRVVLFIGQLDVRHPVVEFVPACVDGTLNILEYARHADKTPHIIFASSSSVYGSNPELPKHERMATMPRSPYAASKLSGEAYVLAYQDSFGVPALPFRFFNVYGPLQAPGHAYAAVVPAFYYAALHNEPVLVHGDGSQTRDFTHVDTVARVITEAILGKVTSGIGVNLAFGTRYSLLDVLSIMQELLGHPIERAHGPSRGGDVHDSQAASDLLVSLFPRVSPILLRDGLTSTLEWMRTLA